MTSDLPALAPGALISGERRELKRAYARGYNAGSRGVWPEHRPPLPPEPIIGQLVATLRGLRDAADGIRAVLTEDDEFAQQLTPHIDAADIALALLSAWLRREVSDDC